MKKVIIGWHLFVILSEEAISYYLTFKWSLPILSAIAAIFPTYLFSWALLWLLKIDIDQKLLFFLSWFFILAVFIYEIGLPEQLKNRVRKRLNERIHNSKLKNNP